MLSADGVTTVVLTWQQIEADEPVGGGISCSALQLYGSSCLLRLAAGSAQFEEDRASVHLITPGDALVSQTGAALGVCLLRPRSASRRCRPNYSSYRFLTELL